MVTEDRVTVRLSEGQMAAIERAAAAAGITKADYCRQRIFAAAPAQPDPHSATSSEALSGLADRLSSIETTVASLSRMPGQMAALEAMPDAIVVQKRALVQMVELLREMRRVPTFREYRARRIAEDNAPKVPDNLTALTLLARDYLALYGMWPTPEDHRSFGSVPREVDAAAWPGQPPQ